MGKASRAKRDGSRRAWDRRSQREASPGPTADGLVQVQSWDEVTAAAERGETLSCGCDAHQLLHSGGWHTFDELDD